MSMKIQLTIKLRRIKGNFIWAKLRIITQKADSREALRTVPLLEVEGTVIYIFETKDHTSKWHTDILHKGN